jgi:hypothetical protein
MVEIIKAKREELVEFINSYKGLVAKAEAKLEVYDEILAEVKVNEMVEDCRAENEETVCNCNEEPTCETENTL